MVLLVLQYVFSSFISRDKAYKTLVGVWRKSEEVQVTSCIISVTSVYSVLALVS